MVNIFLVLLFQPCVFYDLLKYLSLKDPSTFLLTDIYSIYKLFVLRLNITDHRSSLDKSLEEKYFGIS